MEHLECFLWVWSYSWCTLVNQLIEVKSACSEESVYFGCSRTYIVTMKFFRAVMIIIGCVQIDVCLFQLLAEIGYSLHMGIHCPCNHCDTGECVCVCVGGGCWTLCVSVVVVGVCDWCCDAQCVCVSCD